MNDIYKHKNRNRNSNYEFLSVLRPQVFADSQLIGDHDSSVSYLRTGVRWVGGVMLELGVGR